MPTTARRNTRARTDVLAGLLALVLPLSACGTRMSEERIDAADGTTLVEALRQTGAQGTPLTPTGNLPAASDFAAPVAGGQPAAPGTVAAPTTTDARTSGAGGDAKALAGGTPGKAATAGNPATAAAAAPCAQSLAPVIIGQTSPSSGIIGAAAFNMRAGLALWARDVNSRGGVQCHPVQLIQMDDAADPARVTANLNQMKARGAVAIVGAGVPTTFGAAKRFADQTKLPFVGGDLIETPWFASPHFFPQGGSALASYGGATKEAANKAGTTKVGLIYCVEAGICGVINENFEAIAKAAGLQVVLRKVASITAPDYTAECQALKAAGAEATFVALEGSGNARFARSCLSLGYAPPTSTSALAISAEAAKDENFRTLGVFLGSGVAPFAATDTVGTREFRAAYERITPGGSIDQNTISQWTAGKLFEKALAKVAGKARSGPITTDLIYEGLWQIKDEKLDGLAPGISFNKNGLPSPNDCYFVLNLTTEGYSAPKGSRYECFKGLPKGF